MAEEYYNEGPASGEMPAEGFDVPEDSIAARHQGDNFNEEFQKQLKKAPWFAISAAIHGVMLVLFGLIVVRPVERAQAMIEVKSEIVTKEEEELLEEPERAEVEQPKDLPPIDPNVTSEVLVKDNLELDDVTEVETDSDDDVAVGEPDNMLVSEVAGPPGMFDVMGAGGGGGGGFGQRGRGGRQTRVRGGGGGRRTESAVNSALRWLARHQEPNGQWSCTKYEGSKEDGDIAVSALACLAFLGAGHSPNTKSEYQATIKKGIDWLISQQKPDGSFKNCNNYGNGTASMALAEAFGMGYYSADGPAKRAVDYLVSAQGIDGGWNYTSLHNKPGRNDNSVAGWCIMALKSAYLAGVNFDQKAVWEKIGGYLQNGKSLQIEQGESYDAKVRACYTFDTAKGGEWKAGSTAMQGASLLISIYHGMKRNDPILCALIDNVQKSGIATQQKRDAYTTYYCTLAMFLTGAKGEAWRKFNETSSPILLQNQRRGDPSVDGSWDPQGGHDGAGGRVMTTAMKAMCLEVYYRYASVFKH